MREGRENREEREGCSEGGGESLRDSHKRDLPGMLEKWLRLRFARGVVLKE